MASRPVTLFVPGPWKDLTDCARRVGELRGSLDWIPNDERFGPAFGPTFAHGHVEPGTATAAQGAPGAALVEVELDLERECPALAAIGRALERAGAVGVCVQQSKVAATLPRWIALLESASMSMADRCGALVVHLASESGLMASCGMHLFGRPDAQIDAGQDPEQAGWWLTTMACYQIAKDPLLRSGHTITLEQGAPPRALVRWPDDRYPPGHPCHNPFGVWRVGPPGSPGHRVRELEPVFTPALLDLLAGLERKAGRPLDRREVEEITGQAVVIAMKPRDARAMELKRGYADLDSDLAWEQWQVARIGLADG